MKEKDKKWWIQVAWASSMGVAMAISIVIGVALGVFLDRVFSTKVFFPIFLLLGIGAAFRSIWYIYKRYLE